MSRYTIRPYYVCIFIAWDNFLGNSEYGLMVYLETFNFSQVHSRSI